MLVRASRAGDTAAFASLVDRYQSLVLALTYRGGTAAAESEDLAQESFMVAWRSLRDLRDPARFRPWLCVIAQNLTRRAARRRGVDPIAGAAPVDAAAGEVAGPEASPLEQVLGREEAAALGRALADLPEKYRVPLVLYYREEQALDAVARLLALSEEAVRQRLSRARRMLGAQLAPLVERGVARSRPATAFTAAVIAGIAAATVAPASATAAPLPRAVAAAGRAGSPALRWAAVLLAGGVLCGGIGLRCAEGSRSATPKTAMLAPATGTRWSGGGAGRAGGAEAATLEGVVLDPEGRPVPGAVVAIAPSKLDDRSTPAPSLVPTGAAGRFSAGGLVPGAYWIGATADGLQGGDDQEIALAAGERRSELVIRLQRAGLIVSGRILDASAGAVAGAHVIAEAQGASPGQGPILATLADDAGAYRLALPSGTHRVTARSPGYAPASRTVWSKVDRQTIDFRLNPAGALVGRVVGPDGEAIAGAAVSTSLRSPMAPRQETETDAAGAFVLGELDPGSYDLAARKDDAVGTVTAVRVDLAARVEGIVIPVKPGGTVSGVCRTAEGAPLPGARITAKALDSGSPDVSEDTTGDDGRFRLRGVLPSRLSLTASATGRVTATREIVVADGPEPPPIELTLIQTATVSGTVLARDGRPLRGVNVTAMGTPVSPTSWGTAQTAADGAFEIGGLGPGAVEVRAVHPEHGTAAVAVPALAPGDRRVVNIRMTDSATVSGSVRWEDGGAAMGVAVIVDTVLPGGRILVGDRVATTDDAGRFTLGPLGSGEQHLRAASSPEDASHSGNEITLRLAEDERRTGVVLSLARSTPGVEGIILGPDGRPVGGASVFLAKAGILSWPVDANRDVLAIIGVKEVATTNDGRFAIGDLEAGAYTVRVKHPDFPAFERRGVRAPSSGVTLELLAGARIAGVVVAADGRPVPDFDLVLHPPAVRAPTLNSTASGPAFDDQPRKHHVHDPRGAFEVGPLSTGTWDLEATTVDGATGRAQVVAQPGRRTQAPRIIVEAPR